MISVVTVSDDLSLTSNLRTNISTYVWIVVILNIVKDSIPFSQALRLRRICSEDRTYTQRTHELEEHFLSRGYHEHHLENEFKRALDTCTSREACLRLKSNQEKSACIPLVVTYHPILPPFHLTTKCLLSIFHASERLQRVFEHSPLIAFRCPRYLRDFLLCATLTSTSRVAWQLPMRCVKMQNLSNTDRQWRVF